MKNYLLKTLQSIHRKKTKWHTYHIPQCCGWGICYGAPEPRGGEWGHQLVRRSPSSFPCPHSALCRLSSTPTVPWVPDPTHTAIFPTSAAGEEINSFLRPEGLGYIKYSASYFWKWNGELLIIFLGEQVWTRTVLSNQGYSITLNIYV